MIATGLEEGVIETTTEEEDGTTGLLDDPGINGTLEGLDAGELDCSAGVEGVALLDRTGVDGVTEAELGTIGLLDDNGTAELEPRGLEEAAALVAGLDGVGVGVTVVHD